MTEGNNNALLNQLPEVMTQPGLVGEKFEVGKILGIDPTAEVSKIESFFENQVLPELVNIRKPTPEKLSILLLNNDGFGKVIIDFLKNHPDIPLVLIVGLLIQRFFSRSANYAYKKFDTVVDTKQNNFKSVIRRSFVGTGVITNAGFMLWYYGGNERVYKNLHHLQPLRDVTKQFDGKDWARGMLAGGIGSVLMSVCKMKKKRYRFPIWIAVLGGTMYMTHHAGGPLVMNPNYLSYIPFQNNGVESSTTITNADETQEILEPDIIIPELELVDDKEYIDESTGKKLDALIEDLDKSSYKDDNGDLYIYRSTDNTTIRLHTNDKKYTLVLDKTGRYMENDMESIYMDKIFVWLEYFGR